MRSCRCIEQNYRKEGFARQMRDHLRGELMKREYRAVGDAVCD
jgi:hypothetical protein